MACLTKWVKFGATAVAFGVGDAAAEFFSAGIATPAVVAAFLAEVAVLIAEGVELAECLEANGQADDAAKIRAKISTLQGEQSQAQAMAH